MIAVLPTQSPGMWHDVKTPELPMKCKAHGTTEPLADNTPRRTGHHIVNMRPAAQNSAATRCASGQPDTGRSASFPGNSNDGRGHQAFATAWFNDGGRRHS